MPLAIIALLIVQFNFGLLPVAQKIVLAELSPWTLFAIRSLCGALVLQLGYALWKQLTKNSPPAAETLVSPKAFLYLSFLGISANQFFLIAALTLTKATVAAIVVPSITLFTYFFAVIFKHESFAWRKLMILSLGGAGVVILCLDSLSQLRLGQDRGALIGDGLCIVAAMSYALYLVQSKKYVGQLPPLQFMSRLFTYSLVWLGAGFLVGDLFLNGAGGRSLPAVWPSALVMWSLFFIVVAPTALNNFLNFWALRFMPASTVSGYICLQTLIGAAAAHWYLGEELTRSYLWAAFCVMASVLLLGHELRAKKIRTHEAHEAS